MAITEDDVRKKLSSFFGTNENTILAEVIDVDESDFSCTLSDDGSDIYNVRLQPILSENYGIITIPKINTQVLAIKIENTEQYMIVKCFEVAKVLIKCDEIILNEGEKGLVNLTDMANWMKKVYKDLQILKNLLLTHPVAGNGAALAMQFNPSTENPTEDMFEDVRFKH